MAKVLVKAALEVDMKLVKNPSLNDSRPVLYVTAIGEKHILAKDDLGTEHKVPFAELEDYQMNGWVK